MFELGAHQCRDRAVRTGEINENVTFNLTLLQARKLHTDVEKRDSFVAPFYTFFAQFMAFFLQCLTSHLWDERTLQGRMKTTGNYQTKIFFAVETEFFASCTVVVSMNNL